MSKIIGLPRQMLREALPQANERVIRALETAFQFYDDSSATGGSIEIDISLAANVNNASIQHMQEMQDNIADAMQRAEMAAIRECYQNDDSLPANNPAIQELIAFVRAATPQPFTPTVTGTTAAGVGTYTAQSGSYQIVGNYLFFMVSLIWTAHTGTGNLTVTGLPALALNAANRLSPLSIVVENLTRGADTVAAYVSPNSNTIILASSGSNAAFAPVTMDTAASIHISGFYEV